jgi:hypothetical protein
MSETKEIKWVDNAPPRKNQILLGMDGTTKWKVTKVIRIKNQYPQVIMERM